MAIKEKLAVTNSPIFFLPPIQTWCLELWGWSCNYGASSKLSENGRQSQLKVQYKMKMQGSPLFKKQEKKVTLKVLKYKPFPFFPWYLSWLAIFYLLFNGVRSKEKIKPQLVSMNFTIFSILCDASFKCKIRAFDSYVESQNYTWISYMHMYFIPGRTVAMLTPLSYLVSWFVHIQPALCAMDLAISKEGLKGKDTVVTLSFPFLLCHHFQHK